MAKQLNPNLTEEQKRVLFEQGTEAPFSGKYFRRGSDGTYHCANCDNPLFTTDEQFDSKCGWPSFTKPVTKDAVVYHPDHSFGMDRTEVLCGKCGAHLGHYFEGEQGFCINSAAFELKEGGSDATPN